MIVVSSDWWKRDRFVRASAPQIGPGTVITGKTCISGFYRTPLLQFIAAWHLLRGTPVQVETDRSWERQWAEFSDAFTSTGRMRLHPVDRDPDAVWLSDGADMGQYLPPGELVMGRAPIVDQTKPGRGQLLDHADKEVPLWRGEAPDWFVWLREG